MKFVDDDDDDEQKFASIESLIGLSVSYYYYYYYLVPTGKK